MRSDHLDADRLEFLLQIGERVNYKLIKERIFEQKLSWYSRMKWFSGRNS